MTKLKEIKIKNNKGTSAQGEVNKGEKMVETAGYLTISQQISGMLDPMIGSQMQHTQIETTKLPTEKDVGEIDQTGIEINRYKPSKLKTMEIGEKANDRIRASINDNQKF